MRRGRTPLRGEAGRVAERVRVVVAAGRDPDDVVREDEPTPGPDGGLLARLSERLPVRLDPGRRPALAIAVVVVVVAVATGLWVLSSRPRSMPVSAAAPAVTDASPLVPSGGAGSSSATRGTPLPASASSSSSAVVVVDVAGKVRKPGLYRLPPGSRVDDALTAAGGPLRGVDLTSLNLAALLVDGQQIAVGKTGAAAPAGPTGGGSSGGSTGGPASGPVNLNTATLDQLEGLPGIGPALGQRILDYRSEHGSFRSVDQLDDVSGIGSVTFQRLKPLVTV